MADVHQLKSAINCTKTHQCSKIASLSEDALMYTLEVVWKKQSERLKGDLHDLEAEAPGLLLASSVHETEAYLNSALARVRCDFIGPCIVESAVAVTQHTSKLPALGEEPDFARIRTRSIAAAKEVAIKVEDLISDSLQSINSKLKELGAAVPITLAVDRIHTATKLATKKQLEEFNPTLLEVMGRLFVHSPGSFSAGVGLSSKVGHAVARAADETKATSVAALVEPLLADIVTGELAGLISAETAEIAAVVNGMDYARGDGTEGMEAPVSTATRSALGHVATLGGFFPLQHFSASMQNLSDTVATLLQAVREGFLGRKVTVQVLVCLEGLLSSLKELQLYGCNAADNLLTAAADNATCCAIIRQDAVPGFISTKAALRKVLELQGILIGAALPVLRSRLALAKKKYLLASLQTKESVKVPASLEVLIAELQGQEVIRAPKCPEER